MRKNKFILRFLAIFLLVGILLDFACEFYISYGQGNLRATDLQAIKVSQSSSPSSNLLLFSRLSAEEENEAHRYSPHQLILHHPVRNPELSKILGRRGTVASEISGARPFSEIDIIISQHRLII